MIVLLLKKYIWIINIVLLVAIAYVIATFISDRMQKGLETSSQIEVDQNKLREKYKRIKNYNRPRSYYNSILKRNLFGATLKSKGNVAGAPVTTLKLELLGTYLTASGYAIGIIKNMDNGKVNGYSEGELIDIITSEKVRMDKVENCRAVITREFKGSESIQCKKEVGFATALGTGSVKKITKSSIDVASIDSYKGIKQLDSGVYQLDKKMLDELLEDPSELINQARVIPQEDGLKFFGIKSSSIFFKIGLRNGDTIHSINEVALNDIQNALSVFTSLKDKNEFTIDFTRRGKKQSNSYTVN